MSVNSPGIKKWFETCSWSQTGCDLEIGLGNYFTWNWTLIVVSCAGEKIHAEMEKWNWDCGETITWGQFNLDFCARVIRAQFTFFSLWCLLFSGILALQFWALQQMGCSDIVPSMVWGRELLTGSAEQGGCSPLGIKCHLFLPCMSHCCAGLFSAWCPAGTCWRLFSFSPAPPASQGITELIPTPDSP